MIRVAFCKVHCDCGGRNELKGTRIDEGTNVRAPAVVQEKNMAEWTMVVKSVESDFKGC